MRLSQYFVVHARELASFWRENVIAVARHSTKSFGENVIVTEDRGFIILRSGEGFILFNKITVLTFLVKKYVK